MYKLEITHRAKKDLLKLDSKYQRAVHQALLKLSNNPFHGKRLHGELKGKFKLRFSRYRIVYKPDFKKQKIIITAIRHRKDVYR